MNLTADTYYSTEANAEYWSASAIKSMLACQAAGLAELRGEWTRPDSDALLIGSYVDAAIEGSLGRFIQYHPQLFKRDGTLKSQYAKADEMARRAMTDPVFTDFLRGEKQKIVLKSQHDEDAKIGAQGNSLVSMLKLDDGVAGNAGSFCHLFCRIVASQSRQSDILS